MSVYTTKDSNDIYIDCGCGCGRGLKVIVDKDDYEDSDVILVFFSSDFNHTQNMSIFNVIKTKLKKIWYIIRNKDYCYSEILLTGKEFDEFRNHLNKIN